MIPMPKQVGTQIGAPGGRVKAAQYLRMSTEHQRYSTENQAAAIAVYAEERGLKVIRTYKDLGKSGLRIQGRPGLAKLISDVVAGEAEFQAILVYDVSRWGRFQDADESAHYEFICRQAGLSVHYCAETFDNEGGLAANLMKSIKRLMAGEYSRELSVKVSAAQRRISALGYKQGGKAGYGLRRWVIEETGLLKGELLANQRKGLQSDRVTLKAGPPDEIAIVRRIYRMFIKDRLGPTQIANVLNAEGVLTDCDRPWSYHSVRTILRSETYIGNHVFGRVSMALQQLPRRRNPPSTWVRANGVFEPIVSKTIFEAAQRVFDNRARIANRVLRINESVACVSDEAMLDILRKLLVQRGYVTLGMLKSKFEMPSPATYRRRFGSMAKAFALIGFERPDDWRKLYVKRSARCRYPSITANVVSALRAVSERCDSGPELDVITLDGDQSVEILIARGNKGKHGNAIWCFTLQPVPAANLTIVARLECNGTDICDYLVIAKGAERSGNHQTSRTCGPSRWRRFMVSQDVAAYVVGQQSPFSRPVGPERSSTSLPFCVLSSSDTAPLSPPSITERAESGTQRKCWYHRWYLRGGGSFNRLK